MKESSIIKQIHDLGRELGISEEGPDQNHEDPWRSKLSKEEILEKWQNISTARCVAIWDRLQEAAKAAGGHLPGIEFLDNDERLSTEGYLQEYAEKLLNDDEFWNGLPEISMPPKEDVAEWRRLLQGIDLSNPDVEEMFTEYKMGRSNKELRLELKNILDTCR